MKTRALLASAMSTLGLVAGGIAVTTMPAEAATPTCDRTIDLRSGAGTLTVPAYGSSTTCLLKRGNSGSAVSALQTALKNCHGKSSLAVDGDFGPATQNAVVSVQTAAGIENNGIYGPITRSKMRFWELYFLNGNARWRCTSIG